MKKEKARLEHERAKVEANLEALELEKEAAAALAEAEVLEAAAMERDDNRSEISTLSSHVISMRTEEYVKTADSGELRLFYTTSEYLFINLCARFDSTFDR